MAVAEVAINIRVPEEFFRVSSSELNRRSGLITAMDTQLGYVAMRATIPASEYDELSRAIAWATSGRGSIERE